jgi:hypothetical protein
LDSSCICGSLAFAFNILYVAKRTRVDSPKGFPSRNSDHPLVMAVPSMHVWAAQINFPMKEALSPRRRCFRAGFPALTVVFSICYKGPVRMGPPRVGVSHENGEISLGSGGRENS